MLNHVMRIGLIGRQRRRRVMFIVFDPGWEMEIRQERHVRFRAAPDGAFLFF